MKGARVPDKQDQNFLYVEYNKIVSLQNPEMLLSKKKEPAPVQLPPPPPPPPQPQTIVFPSTPPPPPQP